MILNEFKQAQREASLSLEKSRKKHVISSKVSFFPSEIGTIEVFQPYESSESTSEKTTEKDSVNSSDPTPSEETQTSSSSETLSEETVEGSGEYSSR